MEGGVKTRRGKILQDKKGGKGDKRTMEDGGERVNDCWRKGREQKRRNEEGERSLWRKAM